MIWLLEKGMKMQSHARLLVRWAGKAIMLLPILKAQWILFLSRIRPKIF